MKSIVLATVALAATAVEAATSLPGRRSSHLPPRVKIAGRSRLADDSVAFSPEHQALAKRQLPAKATGVKKVTSPNGHAVRYKELTDKGICETTKGVRSFSGYIDLSPTVHVFFMFYNSRNNPSKDPFTLWLNGGPGSDSLIGMFEELGPCHITEDLKVVNNPYSYNEYSNMLFLSQPVGTGFSYAEEEPGSLSPITGDWLPAKVGGVDGRYSVLNASTVLNTTRQAADATVELLQTFLELVPEFDSSIKSKDFNFATESYGGHWAPTFSSAIIDFNDKVAKGTAKGVHLNFNSLTIINGIIDEKIQAPEYIRFAKENTYGIPLINQTVIDYEQFALDFNNGCLAQMDLCRLTNYTTIVEQSICAEAANMCRDNVEGPYYAEGERGVYDIRAPYANSTPAEYWIDYVNQAKIQQALGVDLNYTATAAIVTYYAFQNTGDFIYNHFIEDLEKVLNRGIRVELIYGDADYICNWFGGEAISLAVNYTHSAEFRKAGYVPMTVNGTEYGETREYGNFSFTRVYEAGHEVPAYQPVAALALFQRALKGLRTSDGAAKVNSTSGSTGGASATHTESSVALPSSTASGGRGSASDGGPTSAASSADGGAATSASVSATSAAVPDARVRVF